MVASSLDPNVNLLPTLAGISVLRRHPSIAKEFLFLVFVFGSLRERSLQGASHEHCQASHPKYMYHITPFPTICPAFLHKPTFRGPMPVIAQLALGIKIAHKPYPYIVWSLAIWAPKP